MSLTFLRSAAGAALLAVLAAGCGTAVTAQHAGAKPAATAQPHHSAAAHASVTTPASPPATTAPADHRARPGDHRARPGDHRARPGDHRTSLTRQSHSAGQRRRPRSRQ